MISVYFLWINQKGGVRSPYICDVSTALSSENRDLCTGQYGSQRIFVQSVFIATFGIKQSVHD